MQSKRKREGEGVVHQRAYAPRTTAAAATMAAKKPAGSACAGAALSMSACPSPGTLALPLLVPTMTELPLAGEEDPLLVAAVDEGADAASAGETTPLLELRALPSSPPGAVLDAAPTAVLDAAPTAVEEAVAVDEAAAAAAAVEEELLDTTGTGRSGSVKEAR